MPRTLRTSDTLRPARLAARLALPALLAAACAGPDAASDDAPTEFAPTPYTAAQIRASNLPPTSTVYRVQSAGGDAIVQRTEFVSEDGTTVTLRNSGDVPGSPERNVAREVQATWAELRDHAKFPAATTAITEATIEVGAGAFECWRYDVRRNYGDSPGLHRFWFDRETAGSPVLYTVRQDGVEVYRMELLGHDRKPFPKAR